MKTVPKKANTYVAPLRMAMAPPNSITIWRARLAAVQNPFEVIAMSMYAFLLMKPTISFRHFTQQLQMQRTQATTLLSPASLFFNSEYSMTFWIVWRIAMRAAPKASEPAWYTTPTWKPSKAVQQPSTSFSSMKWSSSSS
eukprot:CAMPEP_0115565620 /NCGR_PEP_ID=MMETSP0271-20121206/103164_1 /TAXON_ID=71861 /ORGANISM="Scrippsiella trochoidea, Strain CCMP3099" /LENGTH=139 /DNA_ID=CAMNT_0002999905 /DNA_START=121 /DNA_END=540 /DNA_ORIENTATION=+